MLFWVETDPLENGSFQIGVHQEVLDGQLLSSLLGFPRQQWN